MKNQLDTGKSKFKLIFLLVWSVLGGVFGILAGLSQGVSFDGVLSVTLNCALGCAVYGIIGVFIDGVVNHRWRFHQIEYPTLYWYIYPIVFIIAIFIGMTIAMLRYMFGIIN